MTNPHDPDAHFNGHYEKVGYKANLTETCGKPDVACVSYAQAIGMMKGKADGSAF